MRRTTIPLLTLALALGLSGCGGTEPLTKAQAKSVLLTKANVGRTYTTDEKTPLTARLGCLEKIGSFAEGKAATKPATKDSVQYGNDSLSGLPAVRVEVRSYATPEQARGVLTALEEQSARCSEVRIDGSTSHFAMKVVHDQEKFLKGATAQLNTLGTGEVTGGQKMKLTTGLWLTNALRDNNLLTVTYLNYSAADQGVAHAYAKAAYERLSDVVKGTKPSNAPVDLPVSQPED